MEPAIQQKNNAHRMTNTKDCVGVQQHTLYVVAMDSLYDKFMNYRIGSYGFSNVNHSILSNLQSTSDTGYR